jgi:hypothetical protein
MQHHSPTTFLGSSTTRTVNRYQRDLFCAPMVRLTAWSNGPTTTWLYAEQLTPPIGWIPVNIYNFTTLWDEGQLPANGIPAPPPPPPQQVQPLFYVDAAGNMRYYFPMLSNRQYELRPNRDPNDPSSGYIFYAPAFNEQAPPNFEWHALTQPPTAWGLRRVVKIRYGQHVQHYRLGWYR